MLVGGLAGTPEFIGFGSSSAGASALGTTITFTGGTLTNYAFVMPANGYITDVSASFQVEIGLSVGMNPTIMLYKASAGSNSFSIIPGATLVLPDVSLVAINTVLSGSLNDLSIPVSLGDQILLVAAGTSAGQLLSAGTAEGYLSAGLAIATI
jgi:BclB C-terminal domain-containing protein